MLKSVLSVLTALTLTAPTALAQAHGHDDHKGHAHAKPQAQSTYLGPMSASPEVQHIYTEAPDDHVIGSDKAPVTIIAYASVTCPHCSKWFIEEWPTFKAEQIDTGKARFIMREFPTQPQQLAMVGFIIANCAPKEAYFDHLVDQMQRQDAIFKEVEAGRGKEVYDAIAAKAGMKNEQAIQACFENPEGGARINRAVKRAHAGNISSVPSFIVDGAPFKPEASAANLGTFIAAKLKSGVSTFPQKKMTTRPAK